ncbi:MAG: L-glutamate gamma-semialdehyde dehydrogenase [Balneolales bacterium]
MNKMAIEEFKIEEYLDYGDQTILKAQQAAIKEVRSQFGKSYPLIINGEEVQGEKGTFDSINPSNTNETVGAFQLASARQAESALDAAWKAFETWKYVTAEERAEILFKAAEITQRRRLELIAWEVSESGQNYRESDAQIAEGIDFLNYYAHEALRYDKGMEVLDARGEINRTIYIPLGAGVSISPWNFPFAIAVGMASAPIVAGNTVVAKPSPDTPMMCWLVYEILKEAGLPEGIFNFITGENEEIGDTLTSSPKTRFINFTGSLAVGQHITQVASKPQSGQNFIKRVVTELGGKNAIVIDSDADLDAASSAIVQAAYGYQGQKCSACSRAIIVDEVFEKVEEMILEKSRQLEIGNAKDNVIVGPVINQKAVDKIMSYLEIGKTEGKLLLGGKKAQTSDPGHYIEPTIFTEVDPDARIVQEEIFGPVVALIRAKDTDNALEIANSTRYGLTGGYFSANPANIDKALREFHVGNLYINRKCTGALVGAQPFGGFNLSGTDSKAGGRDYLLSFLQAKSLTEKPLDQNETVLPGFSFSKK